MASSVYLLKVYGGGQGEPVSQNTLDGGEDHTLLRNSRLFRYREDGGCLEAGGNSLLRE